MTFKQKRSYKRKARRLMISAYIVLALFVLLIISSIWWVSKFNEPAFGLQNQSTQMLVFIIVFVSFPFTGLLLGIFSSWNTMERRTYLRNIREWRERNYFRIILDLVERGLLVKTISYYNSMPQGVIRDHTYAILVNEFSKSSDPKLAEQGREKMKEMKEQYDPAKVEFK
jgi:hypothetical protein